MNSFAVMRKRNGEISLANNAKQTRELANSVVCYMHCSCRRVVSKRPCLAIAAVALVKLFCLLENKTSNVRLGRAGVGHFNQQANQPVPSETIFIFYCLLVRDDPPSFATIKMVPQVQVFVCIFQHSAS